MPSGLRDRVQRILPLAKKVADEIVSDETEILKELIPRMFGVMHRAAKLSCDYVKRRRWSSPLGLTSANIMTQRERSVVPRTRR